MINHGPGILGTHLPVLYLPNLPNHQSRKSSDGSTLHTLTSAIREETIHTSHHEQQ